MSIKYYIRHHHSCFSEPLSELTLPYSRASWHSPVALQWRCRSHATLRRPCVGYVVWVTWTGCMRGPVRGTAPRPLGRAPRGPTTASGTSTWRPASPGRGETASCTWTSTFLFCSFSLYYHFVLPLSGDTAHGKDAPRANFLMLYAIILRLKKPSLLVNFRTEHSFCVSWVKYFPPDKVNNKVYNNTRAE